MMENPPPLSDIGFFRIAKRESYNSSFRIRVGAVLSEKHKLICRGYNKLKSHPKYANPEKHIKVSIHAEIDCLLKGSGDTIYVYREYKNGIPAIARPCEDCIRELRGAGIRKIYYSISEFPYWKFETL